MIAADRSTRTLPVASIRDRSTDGWNAKSKLAIVCPVARPDNRSPMRTLILVVWYHVISGSISLLCVIVGESVLSSSLPQKDTIFPGMYILMSYDSMVLCYLSDRRGMFESGLKMLDI